MTLKQFLKKALLDNQLELNESTQDQLLRYLDLLTKWNQVHNLTSIENPHEMVLLHIIDSLLINRFLHGQRIVDVGTGAGLPGIPLALMNPQKHFTLIDSNNKKVRFLHQVVLELGIKNVEPLHSRVEDYAPKPLFDCVITRAFANIKDMLKVTHHLIPVGGLFLAMKGVYPEAELQNISDDFLVLSIHALRINGLDVERHVVCIEKLN